MYLQFVQLVGPKGLKVELLCSLGFSNLFLLLSLEGRNIQGATTFVLLKIRTMCGIALGSVNEFDVSHQLFLIQTVIERFSLCTELLLMFQLMDRVRGGVDPMIANLESYIVTTGLDDMKASADTITSVS